jgi:hypothetical protein
MYPGQDIKQLQSVIRENKCDAVHGLSGFENKFNIYIER